MANYDLTYEGSRVQNILDTGDELRDAGYIFRGEATPSTVPGTPTERVAYIGGPGTYTNFGSSITVGAGCICVFKYTGSAWSNQVINTGLSDAISSEASARQLGDSTLQGGINTVSAAITAINNAIGNGCVYAGIATPSSTPASGKVFYFAFTAGTYINFNNLEVPQGINILKNNGSTWLLDSFLGIDDAPTQGSANLVKSGGVIKSIIQNGPAFDLSAYNAQGGTLATYADLSAALTALNALPADFKKGGMSIKFVLTSDNKYVQCRYMKANAAAVSTFTNIANWQGEDAEPVAGSKNLVESGGVLTNIRTINQSSNQSFQNILKSSGIILSKTTNVTESGSLSSAYIGTDGQIKGDVGAQIKIHYYQVSLGDTIFISGYLGSGWSGQPVVFTKNIPQVGTQSDFTVGQLDSEYNINMLYVVPCDGYIVTQERSSTQTILCYNYEVKDQNSEEIDSIKELTGIEEISEFEEPTGSVSGLYISAGGRISSATNGILKYYSVNAGEKFHLYGDLTSSWTFGTAAFSTSIPDVGVTIQVISLNYAVDMDYVAPANGYIILQKNNSTGLEINLYRKENISTDIITKEVLVFDLGASEELTTDSTIARSYINASGKIAGVSNDNMYCNVYKVYKGVPIIINGVMGSDMSFTAAAFFTSVPAINVTASYIISKQENIVDKKYIPTQNGYIVTWHRNSDFVTLAYSAKYISKTIADIQKDIDDIEKNNEFVDSLLHALKGKIVAVLGDSIIQNMGTFPSDVTVTLKNYDDPTDTTVYQQSDATVVNGIIYLTSSLSGGSVTENSIRLEVVNDLQTDIDSRTWPALKDALKAADIINCGFGAGRIVENGICTSYPTVNILEEGQGSNPWDGKMASLPNEVKMLKRIVDSGLRGTPDAVVIWMGVNGASGVITDTYEEAMAIPWATLSDDVNGYTYRTKFYGAMRYAIEYIYRAFPNVNIFILSPVQTNRGDQQINSSDPAYRGYTTLNEVAVALKKMSDRYACQFVDALHEIGIANFSYKADTVSGSNEVATGVALGNLCPTFLSDGLHPNNAGKVVWKNYLAKRLNSLYFSKA